MPLPYSSIYIKLIYRTLIDLLQIHPLTDLAYRDLGATEYNPSLNLFYFLFKRTSLSWFLPGEKLTFSGNRFWNFTVIIHYFLKDCIIYYITRIIQVYYDCKCSNLISYPTRYLFFNRELEI